MRISELRAAVKSGELLAGGYWDSSARVYVRLAHVATPDRPDVVQVASEAPRLSADGNDLVGAMLEAIRFGYADIAARMARTLAREALALQRDVMPLAGVKREDVRRVIYRLALADYRADVEARWNWLRWDEANEVRPITFGRYWAEYRSAWRRNSPPWLAAQDAAAAAGNFFQKLSQDNRFQLMLSLR